MSITIPTIGAIVYTIVDIVKTASGGSEKLRRFIPLIAFVLGGIIGVIAFFCVPESLGVQNAFVAAVVGAASGLSATGANQVVKQITKGGESHDEG